MATMPKTEKALWDREEQIFNEKLTLDKQLGELYDSGASPNKISTLESKIDALDDEYWDLQPKLAELDKKYAEKLGRPAPERQTVRPSLDDWDCANVVESTPAPAPRPTAKEAPIQNRTPQPTVDDVRTPQPLSTPSGASPRKRPSVSQPRSSGRVRDITAREVANDNMAYNPNPPQWFPAQGIRQSPDFADSELANAVREQRSTDVGRAERKLAEHRRREIARTAKAQRSAENASRIDAQKFQRNQQTQDIRFKEMVNKKARSIDSERIGQDVSKVLSQGYDKPTLGQRIFSPRASRARLQDINSEIADTSARFTEAVSSGAMTYDEAMSRAATNVSRGQQFRQAAGGAPGKIVRNKPIASNSTMKSAAEGAAAASQKTNTKVAASASKGMSTWGKIGLGAAVIGTVGLISYLNSSKHGRENRENYRHR